MTFTTLLRHRQPARRAWQAFFDKVLPTLAAGRFLEAPRCLDVRPGQAVVIEDVAAGIRAATQADH